MLVAQWIVKILKFSIKLEEECITWLEMAASNFSFGLVAFSKVNEILVLLAQTIVAFPLYPIILS